MEELTGFYTDVEAYNEAVHNWDLKFKLLSKSDFSSNLHMIYNEEFSLAKEKLTGKIEQKGKTQEGFIVFGIPINDTPFYWFDKKVTNRDLLIFPFANNFDVISDDNFEVYVVSIHKRLFYEALDEKGLEQFNKLYTGTAQNLFLSKQFSSRFTRLLHYFLNTNLGNPEKNKELINTIVFSLVEYLNSLTEPNTEIKKSKKELAVEKAVELINTQVTRLFSIPQLCALVQVSERTLLSGFKDKYNVTPSDYIKAHRLNMVKHEIHHSTITNISKIAGKYHFWHMGQFAKDFKKQFGILPSEV